MRLKQQHNTHYTTTHHTKLTLEVLGGHDVVGAAVGLARDDGDLGHSGLGVRVQQLGAVADDAAVLLL